MPTIAGLRGTGDWGVDERPKNYRETILFLEPNGMAPLQALLGKMGSEPTDDPEFAWWEEKLTHQRVKATAAAAAALTTLTLAEGGALMFVEGDLIIVETAGGLWANEIVRVSQDPTTDTSLKVTRGAAGTTAADIAAGTYLTKIGNAFAEGTLSPTATTRNPVKLKNFTQIFKTTYSITGTAAVTKSRTGPVLEKDKKRKLFDIMRDMEMACIYGGASETTGANNKPLRTTGGLLSFITTNRVQFGDGSNGTVEITEDNIIDFFSQVFNYDGMGAGNERLAFMGNVALTKLNKIARASTNTRITFDGSIKVYGMELQKWVLPQGTIYFKTHPLFNVHPELTKAVMLINPKGIKERPLRKLKFTDNTQPNNADYKEGEWLTETGFEFNHEETMAFAGGLA